MPRQWSRDESMPTPLVTRGIPIPESVTVLVGVYAPARYF